MIDDIKKEKGSKGSTSFKIRRLQKQYNKILTDLFDKYAAESIEEALDKSDASFGENITDIVQGALDNLREKVLGELGVSSKPTMTNTIAGIFTDEPDQGLEIMGAGESEEQEDEEQEDDEESEDEGSTDEEPEAEESEDGESKEDGEDKD